MCRANNQVEQLYKKVWVYINEKKLPGVYVDNKYLVYLDGYWFHVIPDNVEPRIKPLIINRLNRLRKTTNIDVDRI